MPDSKQDFTFVDTYHAVLQETEDVLRTTFADTSYDVEVSSYSLQGISDRLLARPSDDSTDVTETIQYQYDHTIAQLLGDTPKDAYYYLLNFFEADDEPVIGRIQVTGAPGKPAVTLNINYRGCDPLNYLEIDDSPVAETYLEHEEYQQHRQLIEESLLQAGFPVETGSESESGRVELRIPRHNHDILRAMHYLPADD